MSLKLRIGLRVQTARRAKKLTQAQLAERLEKAVETISNIERGAALTGLDTLEQIAKVLDVKLGYFFEHADDWHAGSNKRLEAEEALFAVARRLPDSELKLATALLKAVAEAK